MYFYAPFWLFTCPYCLLILSRPSCPFLSPSASFLLCLCFHCPLTLCLLALPFFLLMQYFNLFCIRFLICPFCLLVSFHLLFSFSLCVFICLLLLLFFFSLFFFGLLVQKHRDRDANLSLVWIWIPLPNTVSWCFGLDRKTVLSEFFQFILRRLGHFFFFFKKRSCDLQTSVCASCKCSWPSFKILLYSSKNQKQLLLLTFSCGSRRRWSSTKTSCNFISPNLRWD